jgi:hypothetical protein
VAGFERELADRAGPGDIVNTVVADMPAGCIEQSIDSSRALSSGPAGLNVVSTPPLRALDFCYLVVHVDDVTGPVL